MLVRNANHDRPQTPPAAAPRERWLLIQSAVLLLLVRAALWPLPLRVCCVRRADWKPARPGRRRSMHRRHHLGRAQSQQIGFRCDMPDAGSGRPHPARGSQAAARASGRRRKEPRLGSQGARLARAPRPGGARRARRSVPLRPDAACRQSLLTYRPADPSMSRPHASFGAPIRLRRATGAQMPRIHGPETVAG